jgi:hypothetical protein
MLTVEDPLSWPGLLYLVLLLRSLLEAIPKRLLALFSWEHSFVPELASLWLVSSAYRCVSLSAL